MPSDSTARNVLIFRSALLAYSETFIPAQAEKFKTFTPWYTGFKFLAGLKTPVERTLPPTSNKTAGRARNLGAVFGLLDPWYRKTVASIRPELVHAHFEEGGIGSLPLTESLKLPLFVTCHGYDVTVRGLRWQGVPVLGGYYLSRRAALFRKASRCFGVSRFICDTMLRGGYPPEKVQLHYIGVDTTRFFPDPTVVARPQILFVGRLVEKKGCIDLLKAMIEVGAKYPEIELLIVGGGPLREQLETFSREHKINARFLGVHPPDIILKLLRESLIFCAPSTRSQTGDSEGLGIVFLEAQAVGVPVVATKHGGVPEAVEDGVTGLLAEERDPAGLARHILALLSDSALRTEMGRAARARIVREFDLEKQSQLLEQHYLEFV